MGYYAYVIWAHFVSYLKLNLFMQWVMRWVQDLEEDYNVRWIHNTKKIKMKTEFVIIFIFIIFGNVFSDSKEEVLLDKWL